MLGDPKVKQEAPVDNHHGPLAVRLFVTVRSSGKTGVELEALTAASVACLTIYDMLKYVGKGMVLGPIMLLSKTGGKSGDYKRQE